MYFATLETKEGKGISIYKNEAFMREDIARMNALNDPNWFNFKPATEAEALIWGGEKMYQDMVANYKRSISDDWM